MLYTSNLENTQITIPEQQTDNSNKWQIKAHVTLEFKLRHYHA